VSATILRFPQRPDAGAAPAADGPEAPIVALVPRPSPPDAHTHYLRGCAAEDRGDLSGAIRAYHAAIKTDPNHFGAHVNLGRIFHEAGRLQDALVYYRIGRSINPHDVTAAFNVAVALDDLGAAETADAYRETLRLAPTFADAHYNLARLLEATGDHENAMHHLTRYRQLTADR